MTAPRLLLRGPLLMAAVVSAIVLPYLLQLSTQSFIFLLLFSTGLFLTLVDTLALAKRTLQRRLSCWLDTLTLNDVLKSWFDPETGWLACWMAFFVGNATMYTLPLSDDQRVRLVESSLAISNHQAHRILTTPGGFQELLPENIQTWLNSENVDSIEALGEVQKEERKNTNANHDTCDQSDQTDETDPISSEPGTPSRAPSNDTKDTTTPSRSCGLQQTHQGPPPTIVHHPTTTPPPYPMDVMVSILKETAIDFIKQACGNMSDSKIQGVAVAASTAFALQMYASPTSRRIVTNAVQGSAALTFASVAVGAIAGLVAKSRVLDSGQQRQEFSFVTSMLAKLRQVGGVRRVQGMVAVLIFWYVGRRRTRSIQSNVYRPR